MKISHILVLTLWCQIERESESRSVPDEMDYNLLTNSMPDYETVIKLPLTITEGSVIIINGTMDTTQNILTMAMVNVPKYTKICGMQFDVPASTIVVSSELMEPLTFEYDVSREDIEDPVHFTIQMHAREHNGNKFINLNFEADEAGPIPVDHCQLRNFEHLDQIVMRGVATINDLVFKYNMNGL